MMPLLIRGARITGCGSLFRWRGWMKLGYETAPHTARENYRAASSSALRWPEPWPGTRRVLLADEPTGNLDFRTGEMIISLLEDLHRSHKLTSIYVTHNLSFATRCDRILAVGQRGFDPLDAATAFHSVGRARNSR